MRHLVFDKWMWGVLSELCQLSSSSLHMIIYIHFEVFLYCLNINCIHFLVRCLCLGSVLVPSEYYRVVFSHLGS